MILPIKSQKPRRNQLLESAGVYEISIKEQATGSIAIINLANGNIVNRLHVVYDTERIKKAIADAWLVFICDPSLFQLSIFNETCSFVFLFLFPVY